MPEKISQIFTTKAQTDTLRSAFIATHNPLSMATKLNSHTHFVTHAPPRRISINGHVALTNTRVANRLQIRAEEGTNSGQRSSSAITPVNYAPELKRRAAERLRLLEQQWAENARRCDAYERAVAANRAKKTQEEADAAKAAAQQPVVLPQPARATRPAQQTKTRPVVIDTQEYGTIFNADAHDMQTPSTRGYSSITPTPAIAHYAASQTDEEILYRQEGPLMHVDEITFDYTGPGYFRTHSDLTLLADSHNRRSAIVGVGNPNDFLAAGAVTTQNNALLAAHGSSQTVVSIPEHLTVRIKGLTIRGRSTEIHAKRSSRVTEIQAEQPPRGWTELPPPLNYYK